MFRVGLLRETWQGPRWTPPGPPTAAGHHPPAETADAEAAVEAARDRVSHRMRLTAGNFDVNDKPTGAVVGRQPFVPA
ncbi:hypothetical protein FDZ84_25615 [Saccharopolyspora sp. ASAGF58]|nr:hypothetical protein FDZ84_25615 [Saccharopolyspora sp. ASAGF58]